jgi:hypothetical protein
MIGLKQCKYCNNNYIPKHNELFCCKNCSEMWDYVNGPADEKPFRKKNKSFNMPVMQTLRFKYGSAELDHEWMY